MACFLEISEWGLESTENELISFFVFMKILEKH